VILTYSGTDALTLAIQGVLQPGDHVITTVCDHNSVLRPLRDLEERQVIQVTRVGVDPQGLVSVAEIAQCMRPETRMLAIVHASNVTGAIQPIQLISQLTRQAGKLLLVDAAQTVGHIPLSVQDLGCDLLAAPGHKGLLGPTGTGFLYIAPDVVQQVRPVRLGGTGTESENDRQPDELPTRFEAGNHNVPGLVGLGEGVEFVLDRGVANIAQHESQLISQLHDGLARVDGIETYGPTEPAERVGVLSLNVQGHTPQELAVMLDQAASIQGRAGFHCAPLIHDALKTVSLGGTLRLSCGPFTTEQDMETTLDWLARLATV
jgi:selenocysteine lyase/cysteine desulfurase